MYLLCAGDGGHRPLRVADLAALSGRAHRDPPARLALEEDCNESGAESNGSSDQSMGHVGHRRRSRRRRWHRLGGDRHRVDVWAERHEVLGVGEESRDGHHWRELEFGRKVGKVWHLKRFERIRLAEPFALRLLGALGSRQVRIGPGGAAAEGLKGVLEALRTRSN